MTAESAFITGNLKSRLSDRMNPIVVKELRQAVQSRFVTAALMTLLTIQLTAIGIYLLSSNDSLLDFRAGRNIFLLLFGILLGVGMLFVPIYTAARLAAERSDTNVDLLFITTIKPRSIISGKMLAAIVLAILIFSACMPFMTFTYFLRGIDLPTIFLSLAFGFIIVVACTQAAVLVACMPINRAFKVIIGIVVLILFVVIYISVLVQVGRMAWGGVGIGASRADFWRGVAIMLTAVGFLAGLFFALSVAMIKPIASNRALPVRLFITIAWVLMGAAAIIDSTIEDEHAPVIVWNVLFNSIFATSFFAAVSEREVYGRRLLRAVPQSPIKRGISFLFFSGGANGLIWAAVMIVMTLGVVWVWAKLFHTRQGISGLVDSAKWMGGMSLYLFCYALSGALLRHHWLRRIPSEFTWLLGFILLALGISIPILVGYLIFFNEQWSSNDIGKWFVGNPFAWSFKGNRVFFASVGGVWAVLAAGLSLPWFFDRLRQFKPIAHNAEYSR